MEVSDSIKYNEKCKATSNIMFVLRALTVMSKCWPPMRKKLATVTAHHELTMAKMVTASRDWAVTCDLGRDWAVT